MLDKKNLPTVIALGYFDSVHLGHQKVIKVAREQADKSGEKLTVFTFLGNVKAVLNNSTEKSIYLPHERERYLKALGADQIYFAPTTNQYLSQDRKTFLDQLNKLYNISCYVSGVDYTFGAFGKGNISYLSQYAKEHNQNVIVVDTFNMFEKKVSTTFIKQTLSNGNVKMANALLGRQYSIIGKVKKDRQIGAKLGFPTANIEIDNEKFLLKNGVYYCKIFIKDKEYKAVVNYGARPTFELNEKIIEAHILDFQGDLYNQEIEICFLDYIREVKKFENIEQLKAQLAQDVLWIKEGTND